MTPQRWVRIALAYLIIGTLQIGVWALFAPQSFYDNFPGLGRAWVNIDGPFNEHLIRDVGALNLALAVLLVMAAVKLSKQLVMAAGLATLAWGVPHALYHLLNRDGFSGSDLALSFAGLILFALLGGGLVGFASSDRLATT